MTDKEIIVDGVDVGGCKHFKIGTCLADYYLTDMPFSEAKCELNPNCYYKQLKRKEQECEQLKEELKERIIGIKDMSIENTEICKISEKYKQALNEIEKYLGMQQKYFDGEDYHNLLDIINKVKKEK